MHTELSAEQQSYVERLAVPFHPDTINWRVTNKTRDGRRGCVIPYGDQRAYTDRLNQIVTPAGWTRTYEVTTLSPVTRVKKDKAIQTGKVIVTCVVSIHGLGSHCGSGEMWADDDNAMTRAEAQAFKRACSCFGLGRYFYDFPEMWVDLNEYGHPASFPTLPKWALPPGVVLSKIENEHRPNAQANPGVGSERSNNDAGNAQLHPVSSSLDTSLTQQIEDFRRNVGDSLYFETFRRGGPARNARELPNVSAQKWMIQQLGIVERGIMRVRSLAQEIHENAFYAVLDAHKVQSVDKIPSFEVLKTVVVDLQNAAHQSAA